MDQTLQRYQQYGGDVAGGVPERRDLNTSVMGPAQRALESVDKLVTMKHVRNVKVN